MNRNVDWREFTRIEIDTRAVALVLLFVIVIGGALAVRPMLVGAGVEMHPAISDSSASEQAGAGLAWGIAEAGFALSLLAVIAVWRRLPEWLRDVISTDTVLLLYMIGGATIWETGQFWLLAGVVLGGYTALKLADEFDLWWVLNNIACIAAAIVMGSAVGVVLGPWVLGVGLIGLAAYDHLFANEKDWMFTLGSAILSWRLPAVFVIPRAIRLDWDELVSLMDSDGSEEEESLLFFGLGTADLLLPAAFVVALVGGTGGAILPIAVAAGVFFACFRLSWLMSNKGGGAGLPSLTTGALGGWAVGAVVVMLA